MANLMHGTTVPGVPIQPATPPGTTRPKRSSRSRDAALLVAIGAIVALPMWFGERESPERTRLAPVQVVVTETPSVYVDERPVLRETLPEHLRRVQARDPDRGVVVRADRGVRFGRVRGVLRECQAAGFASVSLQPAPGR